MEETGQSIQKQDLNSHKPDSESLGRLLGDVLKAAVLTLKAVKQVEKRLSAIEKCIGDDLMDVDALSDLGSDDEEHSDDEVMEDDDFPDTDVDALMDEDSARTPSAKRRGHWGTD